MFFFSVICKKRVPSRFARENQQLRQLKLRGAGEIFFPLIGSGLIDKGSFENCPSCFPGFPAFFSFFLAGKSGSGIEFRRFFPYICEGGFLVENSVTVMVMGLPITWRLYL